MWTLKAKLLDQLAASVCDVSGTSNVIDTFCSIMVFGSINITFVTTQLVSWAN